MDFSIPARYSIEMANVPSDPCRTLSTIDYSLLQQCMHCGMCLPTCPTYSATLRERNSPRGRIALMREIADGKLSIGSEFADEMYDCLGCLACQSACPAGVNYSELLETARAEIEQSRLLRGTLRRLYRWITLRLLFMHPRAMRIVGRILWLYQRSGMQTVAQWGGLVHLLPQSFRRLESKSPRIAPPFSDRRIAERESPPHVRFRVGLLTGCVQDLIYADVNRATADVLLHNDCEVITPRNQFCCGSLHAHNGDLAAATNLAKRNLELFDLAGLDAIISNAGGCGSHLKKYSSLFAEDAHYRSLAAMWDDKVRDIHEWLVEIGFRRPNPTATLSSVTVVYDDSCHLCHGQQIQSQPRQVLAAVPGVELRPLDEADWCCGSAGIYGITHPDESEKLLQRKLDKIVSAKVDLVATANPGCLLQLSQGAAARRELSHLQVIHPVTMLADAYSREAS